MVRKRYVFLLALVLSTGIVFVINAQNLPLSTTPAPAISSERIELEDAVSNVAGTVGKAVVSISTEQMHKLSSGSKRLYFNRPFGESPSGNDEDLRKFFEDFFGNLPKEYKQMGLGSGVIINKDGYILTNAHVIEGADKVTVTLADGRVFKGEVKGQDPRSDLAVIKINAHNLPVALLGDSDGLKIGQWVVAIGNPYAFAMQNSEPTVTQGVISALHRSLGRMVALDRDYGDLIQTDAAINPGNSGGPLVNLKGEVVAINVAIFSTTGGYQGIGFAIPINTAKRIIERLIEGKKIVYGWLGITVQDLTEDLAAHFAVADKSGVLVAKVLEDGPAQKAGVKEGDIIKRLDSTVIRNVRELLTVVGRSEAGKKVKIALVRDKKQLVLDVTIGARPQNLGEGGAGEQGNAEAKKWRGLNVDKNKDNPGVVVTDIEPGSAADEAGLAEADVILEINKEKVDNLADYQRIIKTLKGSCLVRTSRGYFVIKEKSEK